MTNSVRGFCFYYYPLGNFKVRLSELVNGQILEDAICVPFSVEFGTLDFWLCRLWSCEGPVTCGNIQRDGSTRCASLVAQMARNLPAVQETWVRSLVRKIPWRREWQPTPVFLPGECHGQRSLVGYSTCRHKDSDTTERLTHSTGWGWGQYYASLNNIIWTRLVLMSYFILKSIQSHRHQFPPLLPRGTVTPAGKDWLGKTFPHKTVSSWLANKHSVEWPTKTNNKNKRRACLIHRRTIPGGLLLVDVNDVFHQQVPLKPIDPVSVQNHFVSTGWAAEPAPRGHGGASSCGQVWVRGLFLPSKKRGIE